MNEGLSQLFEGVVAPGNAPQCLYCMRNACKVISTDKVGDRLQCTVCKKFQRKLTEKKKILFLRKPIKRKVKPSLILKSVTSK